MAPQKVILYGVYASPPTRCVLMTAKALGIPVDLKMLNILTGEQHTPEFLKLNPQHTIPTMDDNGFILWDSHAISAYLINKYSPKDCSLYPKDAKIRALIDQRLHFETAVLFGRLRTVLEPILYAGETVPDPKDLEKINGAYDFLETFLQTDPYLVGNSITLADLSCVTSVTSLHHLVAIDESKYPKITAWVERLKKSLPYYEEINQTGTDQFAMMYRMKTGQA